MHALIPSGVLCLFPTRLIVEAIAQACPLIEGISVTNNGRDEPLSPAETWARHFPRLKALSFRNGWLEYQPTKLDAIRATALVTNATKRWTSTAATSLPRSSKRSSARPSATASSGLASPRAPARPGSNTPPCSARSLGFPACGR